MRPYAYNAGMSCDEAVLHLLRRRGSLSVSQLAEELSVTATAVRQRLSRVMAAGLVEREVARAGRGRPSHQYRLTATGQRQAGDNFADLAVVLWREVRGIKDPEVRRGLLGRLANHLAELHEKQFSAATPEERLAALQELFADRHVPVEIEEADGLPVLTVLACPYPGLAEEDRGVCAMEKMLFARLLDRDVRLTQCRLDGGANCTFEVGVAAPVGAAAGG